jgi:hypothetical protein
VGGLVLRVEADVLAAVDREADGRLRRIAHVGERGEKVRAKARRVVERVGASPTEPFAIDPHVSP